MLRSGVGVVHPKTPPVEPLDTVIARAEKAIRLFGPARVVLNPDGGLATFAENPGAGAKMAQQKLATVAQAARVLGRRYGAAQAP